MLLVCLTHRDGTAKVGDVGMAKIMAGDYVSGVLGTFAWCAREFLVSSAGALPAAFVADAPALTFHRSAPELLLGRNCTTKADMYSFGVVLWEIVTGELPVRGQMRATQ